MRPAFTLIELLVVITIIVVLVAMLTPALESAVYRAKLASDAGRQSSLLTLLTMAATDQRRMYLSGARTHDGFEHGAWVSEEMVDTLVSYGMARSHKTIRREVGVDWGAVPDLLIDGVFSDFGYLASPWGYYIGYSYLGNQPTITDANQQPPPGATDEEKARWRPWESPLRLGDAGELVVCHTLYMGTTAAIYAHTLDGPAGSPAPSYGYFNLNQGGPPDTGHYRVAGTFAGMTDGSVNWRDFDAQMIRRAHAPLSPHGYYPAWW